MENEIQALIMPLSEQLIKRLSEAMERSGQGERNRLWLELTVWAQVMALAAELMVGMIGLLFGRGY